MFIFRDCCKRISLRSNDDNDVENDGETHFLVNVDNGRKLSFCGDYNLIYANVVSGREWITVMVRILTERTYVSRHYFWFLQIGQGPTLFPTSRTTLMAFLIALDQSGGLTGKYSAIVSEEHA